MAANSNNKNEQRRSMQAPMMVDGISTAFTFGTLPPASSPSSASASPLSFTSLSNGYSTPSFAFPKATPPASATPTTDRVLNQPPSPKEDENRLIETPSFEVNKSPRVPIKPHRTTSPVSRKRARVESEPHIQGYLTHPHEPKSFFGGIDFTHLPHVISGYLQLLFNLIIVSGLLFLMYQFVATISRDVDLKVDSYSTEIMAKISLCAKHYLDNRCDPPQRIPAMEKACSEWEICMNRDPREVDRARVSAETFAGILNSFIEPMSYKTMIFLISCVVTFVLVSNLAFGFVRSRMPHTHTPLPPPPQQQYYFQPANQQSIM